MQNSESAECHIQNPCTHCFFMCVCLCHCQHVTPRARGCHYQKLSPTLQYIIIWQLLQDNLPEISFHNHPSEKGSIHTGHNLAFDTENLTSMLQHCKNIRFHFFINLRRDAVLSLDLAIFHSGLILLELCWLPLVMIVQMNVRKLW